MKWADIMQDNDLALIEKDILGLYQELIEKVITSLESLKIKDYKNRIFSGKDFIRYSTYNFDAEDERTEILIYSIIKSQFKDAVNELSEPIVKMMWLYNCVDEDITKEKLYMELENYQNIKEKVVEKLCYMLCKKVDCN